MDEEAHRLITDRCNGIDAEIGLLREAVETEFPDRLEAIEARIELCENYLATILGRTIALEAAIAAIMENGDVASEDVRRHLDAVYARQSPGTADEGRDAAYELIAKLESDRS